MTNYRQILERSAIVVLSLTEAGTIVDHSPEFTAVTGHSDLRGQPLLEHVHPTDRETVAGLFGTDGDAHGGGFRVRTESGSWEWLEVLDPIAADSSTASTVLLLRHHQPDPHLVQRLERLEVLLDSVQDAVYAIDSEGTIVYVNEAYARMKGVDRDALLGTNIYTWGSETARRKIETKRAAAAASGRKTGVVEFELSTADGETIPVELRFTTVGEATGDIERVGIIRDISARKEHERRLEEQNERLAEFASIVSHDLRNPLTVAAGRVDLAAQECESEHLPAALQALDRMDRLVDDLLNLARDGETVGDVDEVDLETVVGAGWQSVETGDMALEVTAGGTILADRSRLLQVFENLFRNAADYGGDRVRVGPLPEGFYVEDTGPGVPPEHREAVFDVGYSTSPAGTGYGLTILKRIVDAHGWTVDLTEGATGGARFEIRGVQYLETSE